MNQLRHINLHICIFSAGSMRNIQKIKIINIHMNGKNINHENKSTNDVLESFLFPDLGKNELFVLVDIRNITSLNNSFSMPELNSISFTEEFKTENITSMDGIFEGSKILKEVNMSYLNLENVKSMIHMFSNCKN